MEDNNDEMERSVDGTKSPWLGRVGLLLLSTVLSSFISVAAVSVGWKSSIDTINAVDQVKIAEHEARLNKIDRKAVSRDDLVERDQLLDSKLSLLNFQISALKDQLTNMEARKGRER